MREFRVNIIKSGQIKKIADSLKFEAKNGIISKCEFQNATAK